MISNVWSFTFTFLSLHVWVCVNSKQYLTVICMNLKWSCLWLNSRIINESWVLHHWKCWSTFMMHFAVLWGSTSVWPPQQLSAQLFTALTTCHILPKCHQCCHCQFLNCHFLPTVTDTVTSVHLKMTAEKQIEALYIKYNIREIKRECQFIADKLWLTKWILFVLYCITNWLWSLTVSGSSKDG